VENGISRVPLRAHLLSYRLSTTMKFSSKFLSAVYLAVVCASGAVAAPWAQDAKHATHRVREISPTLKLETYHPESTYEVRVNDSGFLNIY
jgi:hypothetical protein